MENSKRGRAGLAAPQRGVFQALCERWENNFEHLRFLQNWLFSHRLHGAAVSTACLYQGPPPHLPDEPLRVIRQMGRWRGCSAFHLPLCFPDSLVKYMQQQ